MPRLYAGPEGSSRLVDADSVSIRPNHVHIDCSTPEQVQAIAALLGLEARRTHGMITGRPRRWDCTDFTIGRNYGPHPGVLITVSCMTFADAEQAAS